MAAQLKASEVEKAIRALITAERTNLGIEVTVPVAYGDGELASVVVENNGDSFRVHDAGFSAMRLTGAGVALSRSVVHRLNEYCQRYHCTFSDGRVSASAAVDNVAQAVCLVANASRAVADYVYEIRRQSEFDFRTMVFDKLKEIVGPRVRNAEEFIGRSGRKYRLPILLDRSQSRPQNFLATLAHRHTVPQSYAMFADLKGAYPLVEQDAVYDETADIREEDRIFIASVGAEVFTLMEAPLRFRAIAGHA
ncbi:hypothetical protein KMZ93_01290 [Bradyrhizobium sediminis]|uniref:DUF1828 domain-containing protein n=1 Tax=Bradyrhizobium sediminis TaxID=2840469 RepID=A0A975NZ46_9BRAD|nr:hypothetical protein [Bradyrhizobium sediminis]QWG23615.1 hypothetical protein KMZ93_01290 [Bradyrhizobium sediminis]